MRSRRSVRALGLVASSLTLAGLAVAIAPSADAAAVYPGLGKLTAIGHTGITVTVGRITNDHPTSYRVVASTTKAHVTTSYLNAHSFRSDHTGSATGNVVKVSGMPFSASAPYYYRVGVTYKRYPGYVAWSSGYSSGFGLAPNAVTGLSAVRGGAGWYLKWTNPSGGSTGAAIDQLDTATGARTTYTIHQTTPRFTPYGLGRATYTYRVRAINFATHSASSASSASITGPVTTTALRVMSYNVLGAVYGAAQKQADGRTATVSGWSSRVSKAAALVAHYKPDVLAVEEGDTILGDTTNHPGNHAYPGPNWSGNWFSTAAGKAVIAAKRPLCNPLYNHTDPVYRGTAHYWPYRQADSLCDYTNVLLKSATYARAIDGTPIHNGSTNYLIYNRTTTSQLTAAQIPGATTAECWGSDDAGDTVPTNDRGAVTCGGFWSLESADGYQRTAVTGERAAAWGVFEKKGTSTPFLLVGAHTSAESGYDARRTEQVAHLISLAQAKARALGITRIIYAGDYNTYPGRNSGGVTDVTTPLTRAAGLPDSSENAQHKANTQYMSSNFYSRSPKKQTGGVPGYANLDHIYLTPGIAVSSFGIGVLLSKGQFVGAIPSDHNPVWADLYLAS